VQCRQFKYSILNVGKYFLIKQARRCWHVLGLLSCRITGVSEVRGPGIVVPVVFGVAPVFPFENNGVERTPHEPEGGGAANLGWPDFWRANSGNTLEARDFVSTGQGYRARRGRG
jgi:hypothetical protein